ncbi:alpha/beta fold hydrolase [Paenarthrobacter sp. DKR-5]|uniref:alpha/beta hydrolase n=1 Tax=Paenarthrobacter sp. DKR-5 TaxID=2835535 RepID=UPI001BDD7671|nr:alpha/beta fold hydrolase [Paenarthrobacter sp. DKR-5]MBT1002169.1 alpha/beta fold hydrolase [Paenarthrobacter sp. DKR-5]
MTESAGPVPFSSDGHGSNARIGVALSHGFTGSTVSMLPWAHYLAERGFAVRLPLLPGHGTRWEDLAKTRWEQWYDAFETEYLELAGRTEVVFAAGLSMGGTLALRLAEHHPTAGLALVNPALTFSDRRAPLAGLLKYFLKSTPAIGDDILKEGVTEGAYPFTPVAGVHQLRRLFLDTGRNLSRIAAPTMLFRSTVDNVVPESSVDLIRERIGSREFEVVPLPNSRHVATLDNDAELIFERSARFFLETAERSTGTGRTRAS